MVRAPIGASLLHVHVRVIALFVSAGRRHGRVVQLLGDAAVVTRTQGLRGHHLEAKLLLLTIIEGSHLARLVQDRVVETSFRLILLYVVEVQRVHILLVGFLEQAVVEFIRISEVTLLTLARAVLRRLIQRGGHPFIPILNELVTVFQLQAAGVLRVAP